MFCLLRPNDSRGRCWNRWLGSRFLGRCLRMEVRTWGKKGTDKVQKKDFLVADHVVLLSLVDAGVKVPEIILHGS